MQKEKMWQYGFAFNVSVASMVADTFHANGVSSGVKWVSLSSPANEIELTPAQRKFATFDKFHNRQRNNGLSKVITTKKAKTEDFLSFLCTRDSSKESRPSYSKFINASMNDSHQKDADQVATLHSQEMNESDATDYQRMSAKQPEDLDDGSVKTIKLRSNQVMEMMKSRTRPRKHLRSVSRKNTFEKSHCCKNRFVEIQLSSDGEQSHEQNDEMEVSLEPNMEYYSVNCDIKNHLQQQKNNVDNLTELKTSYKEVHPEITTVKRGKICCISTGQNPNDLIKTFLDEETINTPNTRDIEFDETPAINGVISEEMLGFSKSLEKSDSPKSVETFENEKLPKTAEGLTSESVRDHCTRHLGISGSETSITSVTLGDTHNFNRLLEAPTYCPSDELFEEPVSYVELLQGTVSLCRIVPPSGWHPPCQLAECVRFPTRHQYIHRLRDREGPNVLRLSRLKNHLKKDAIQLEQLPQIGGVEVDLVAVLDAVRQCGGLNSVVSEGKWMVVGELSKTVKCSRESTSRLYDIYCRYLMSFDSLNVNDVQTGIDEANKSVGDREWSVKGRFRTLKEFSTIAQNVTNAHFNVQPTSEQVEQLYWQYVYERQSHVAVQSGRLNGSAFPPRTSNSPYSQHGWNFNVVNSTKLCLLRRHFDCCADITSPFVEISMMFSTRCWSRSCHFLPYLHYLHQGADVIWYCIAANEAEKFKRVVKKLAPSIVDIDKGCDASCVMISPFELIANGINVTRSVQRCGQYIFVTPGCFTATVATGFSVSETVHLATSSWLHYGFEATQLFRSLSIPDTFSMSKLLCSIAVSCDQEGGEVAGDMLEQALPLMKSLFELEFELQSSLIGLGLSSSATGHDEHIRCDVCKMLCFMSMVVSEQDDVIYCLEHAFERLQSKSNVATYKIFYQYTEVEMQHMLKTVERCLNVQ